MSGGAGRPPPPPHANPLTHLERGTHLPGGRAFPPVSGASLLCLGTRGARLSGAPSLPFNMTVGGRVVASDGRSFLLVQDPGFTSAVMAANETVLALSASAGLSWERLRQLVSALEAYPPAPPRLTFLITAAGGDLRLGTCGASGALAWPNVVALAVGPPLVGRVKRRLLRRRHLCAAPARGRGGA